MAFHVIFSIQAPHLCTSVSCLSMAPCYGDKLTWTLDSPVHNAVDCSCFLALFNICHCQPAGGGLNLSEEKGGVGSTWWGVTFHTTGPTSRAVGTCVVGWVGVIKRHSTKPNHSLQVAIMCHLTGLSEVCLILNCESHWGVVYHFSLDLLLAIVS